MKRIVSLAVCLLLVLSLAVSAVGANNATATIASANAKPGETVTVKITLSNSEPLKSILIRPSYDNSVVEMLSGEWLISGMMAEPWSEEFGDASIAFNNNEDVNGAIFEMTFRIKPSATVTQTTIQAEEFTAKAKAADNSENDVPITVVSGTITIQQTHTHTLIATAAKAATCTEDGNIAFWYCSGCGKYFSDANAEHEITQAQTVVPTLGHDWGEWTESKAAKCTEKGEEKRVCKRDGNHTETRETEALGHDYVAVVTAPTCTENGYTTYTCSRCDDSYTTDETEALGHDWGEWTKSKAAKCTEKGEEKRVCKRDGNHTETRETEALGHDYVAVVTVPTCTENGYTTYTCSRCSDSYTSDETAALGHDWGEWVRTKDPTETEPGEETRTCKRDPDHTETREIPPLDHTHNLTATAAKAANCTESGNIAYWYCSGCGKYFSDEAAEHEIDQEETVVAALGHDWGEWTVSKAATCTEQGEETRTCKRDATHTETRETDALGHDWGEWVDNGDGTETHVCKRDETHTETREKGHEHIPGETVRENETEAKCVTAGGYDEVVYCTECKEELSRVHKTIPALGHDWSAWSIIKEATTEETGLKQRSCKRCDQVESREIAKLPTQNDNEPTPTAEPLPFTDLAENAWYLDAVRFAWENGLMQGVSDTRFCPDAGATRAMFVTVLYREAGEPEVGASSFADAPAGAWYAKAVAWAEREGFITGYEDGLFHPEVELTRQQLALILWRMAGSPRVEERETGASSWAAEAMSWAAETGLLQGDGTEYLPKKATTRAELAEILYRYLRK